MKKLLIIIVLLGFIACDTIFANWLNDFTDTLQNVNTVINPNQTVKVALKNLINSDTKYKNKSVKTVGVVTGLFAKSHNQFIMLLNNGNSKLEVYLIIKPNVSLLDTITVIGIFNGEKLINAKISTP